MKPSLKYLSWGVLGGYAILAMLYGMYLAILNYQQAHPEPNSMGPLACGNTVIDPLMSLLNWSTPLALIALVVTVGTRHHAGRPARWPIALASILFVLPTVSLLGYAIWLFHGPPFADSGMRVADVVWWMLIL